MATILGNLLGTISQAAKNIDADQIKQFTGGSVDSVDEFMRKTDYVGPKNYGRGFLAGVLGGMAGVAVKMIIDRNLAPEVVQLEDKLADNIVDAAERSTGIDLNEDQEQVAEAIVEMGIGMLIGGVYGLVVEALPEAKAEIGGKQEDSVFLTAQQMALPALGMIPAGVKDVAQDKIEALAGHIAFGATTEIVRRASRYYMER